MAANKWLPAAIVAGVCFGSLTLKQSASAATLTPISPTVIAGNSVTLTLNDTISAKDLIGGVELLVTYNSLLLNLVSVADGTDLINPAVLFGPPTLYAANVSDPTKATQVVIIIEDNNSPGDAQGSDSVVTLNFQSFASDPTKSTDVTVQATSDAVNAPQTYQLAAISDTINITAVPTPVPEPGTIALVLAPVLVAAGLKRHDRC